MINASHKQKGIRKSSPWLYALAIVLFLMVNGVSQAENAHHPSNDAHNSSQEVSHEEISREEIPHEEISHEHSSHQEEGDHAGSIPVIYKLYWVGLICMVIILIGYFFLLLRKEQSRLINFSTFILIFLALSLYLFEQGRVFTGYFDPVRQVFVPGYHEMNEMGFLRFIYKLIVGIALCGYGFSLFFFRPKDNQTER